MKNTRLAETLTRYRTWLADNPSTAAKDAEDRAQRISTYAGWDAARMKSAKEEDLVELFAPLWTMKMWGNKEYKVGEMVADNGLEKLTSHLAALLWGSGSIVDRWDAFRGEIKWIGPSMMSELLGYVHPKEHVIWNKLSVSALEHLGISGSPRQSYQVDGESYDRHCQLIAGIAEEMAAVVGRDADLLEVNYFLWEVNQWAEAQAESPADPEPKPSTTQPKDKEQTEFLHNEVKEKIVEVGKWLGFDARIEVKVSAGSVVDAVWEATIGNMGRVIYVFEVQSKGSIDSLILNLLKSKKNPAVQGVVAVSDGLQLAKIKAHAADVEGLANLRCWDYLEVLKTHEQLQSVNEVINALDLVPKGFGG